MSDEKTSWHQIRLFALLTVAMSLAGYLLLSITDETNIFLLGAPAAAAIITKLVMQRNLSGLQLGFPSLRWIPISYLLPFGISGSAFLAYWVVASGFKNGGASTILSTFATAAGPIFLATALFAVGEELGWRAFLVTELAKSYHFRTVALVTGLIWAVWHWPLILLSTDVTGLNLVSPLFAIPVFTIILTSAGVLLAWITLRSKSIWPAVVLHGAQNAFTHGFFMEVTSQTEFSPHFVSEAGGLLAVTWGGTAWIALRRHNTNSL